MNLWAATSKIQSDFKFQVGFKKTESMAKISIMRTSGHCKNLIIAKKNI